jgi:hypothetical protein
MGLFNSYLLLNPFVNTHRLNSDQLIGHTILLTVCVKLGCAELDDGDGGR